jgi:hypothetical protein
MFKHERHRSRLFAAHALIDAQKSDESESGLVNIVMTVGPILAAIASIFAFAELKSEKKEEPGADAGGDAGEQSVTPIGVTSTSSPLVGDVSNTRVKTSRADASTRVAIKNAAAMKKVDYALLYAVAGAESSFRSDVGADTSSAVGLFQFTEGTWSDLCRQYHLPYTAADRKDPQKSAEVASLYINSITTTLQRVLGRKPTYGEVYMGYFLGPSGASSFLKALRQNPNAIGAEMFPKAAKANPNVFYEHGNRSKPLTLRQILAKQEGKIISYAQEAEPNQSGISNPQTVEVALHTPEQGSATGGSSIASSHVAQTSYRPGVDSKGPVAVQQAVPQVTASAEQAPDVTWEKPDRQSKPQQPPLVAGNGSDNSSLNKTIIRGRDNRIYVVNT